MRCGINRNTSYNSFLHRTATALELYKNAVITTDLPELGLCKSDIVFVVDDLGAPDGSHGYAVEVSNVVGEVLDVCFIAATALEPLLENEVFSVRRLATTG